MVLPPTDMTMCRGATFGKCLMPFRRIWEAEGAEVGPPFRRSLKIVLSPQEGEVRGGVELLRAELFAVLLAGLIVGDPWLGFG